MKKVFKIALMLVFMGSISFAQAQNAEPKQPVKSDSCKYHKNFVDENKDGICDNYAKNHATGKGKNFVDENKDGVCDHRAQNQPKGCQGTGQGKGCQGKRGCVKK